MSPAKSSDQRTHRTFSQAKFFGKCRSLLSIAVSFPYLSNLFFGKFCSSTRRSNSSTKNSTRVHPILTWSYIFKVLYSVVSLYTIYMVTLKSFWSFPNKSFCYQGMYCDIFLYRSCMSFFSFLKNQFRVTVRCFTGDKYSTWSCVWSSASPFNPAITTDFVKIFKSFNRLPDFFHRKYITTG